MLTVRMGVDSVDEKNQVGTLDSAMKIYRRRRKMLTMETTHA